MKSVKSVEKVRIESVVAHRRTVVAAAVIAIFLAVSLRLIAPDSDPYARLSWSSGLLTDEGYYIHNARNLVLFGAERTDDFNNMLIMPTLHYVQVVVFRLWGASIVPARMISVVCSLISVLVLFAAARRAFGLKVAVIAATFIGLDHTNLLYNRLALMDTPGEMLLVFALYAWVRGMARNRRETGTRLWLLACGGLLGTAFVTRGLAGIVIPAVFAAACIAARQTRARVGLPVNGGEPGGQPQTGWDAIVSAAKHPVMPLAAGLALVLTLYFVTWYAPHRAELTRINHYYLWGQIIPASGQRLALNIANAWFGDERGAAPFLMRHTPLQTVLVFGWAALLLSRWRAKSGEKAGCAPLANRFSGPTAVLALCWLACAALFLNVASYSPSRYYLLFYPALALAAAFSLVNIAAVLKAVAGSRLAVLLLGAYCSYHAALLVWHHATVAAMAAVGASALCGGASLLLLAAAVRARPEWMARCLRIAPAAALIGWAGINACFTADWLAHLTYAQRDASRWLAMNMPPNTVMIGDVAPGVCLYNRFRAVSVISGLCNDKLPVERFAQWQRAVVILDGAYKERWWTERYPAVVRPVNRIALFPRITRFPVGVYRVRDER